MGIDRQPRAALEERRLSVRPKSDAEEHGQWRNQMKKLLITTAALLAFATPALAGNTIPVDFHGEWCSLNGSYSLSKADIERYPANDRDPCGKYSDGWIKITANRYDGHEQSCKPVNVAKLPVGIVVKLRCVGEGDSEEFNLTVELFRTAGSGSGSKTKRLYIETK
jgi:hypothetical protein